MRFGVLDNTIIVATVQLLVTPIPHLGGFYLYAPYGPLVTKELNENLIITELLTYIKEQYRAAWFIRFEPKQSLPLPGIATQRIQPSKTLVTDLTQTAEELLAGMHPKTRYNIKVAKKHSVEVTHESAKNLNDINTLLTQTSDRQNYHSYPAHYYSALINFLSNEPAHDCQLHIYQAYLHDELLATAVMIDHGAIRTYLFGGSNDNRRNVMAPYALHFQAMQDVKVAGIKSYDWWGIETATGKLPGFVQFKLRWGGEQITYPPAIDIVLKRGWYSLYKILRFINRLF